MSYRYLPLLCLLLGHSLAGQTIKVQPYLQQATPHSIFISWETNTNDESIVEWGTTSDLGNTTSGTALVSDGSNRVHEVQLTGLERFTVYHYRVRTGSAVSDIQTFRTPPFAADQQPFRLLAMSDMQRDGNQPGKFLEVVEQGVIPYLDGIDARALHDQLAMVLIPGDLVESGTTYSQWENHFFRPAQSLLGQVPVYPVLGNHENNSSYYFRYFHLPENGSPGFLEHWWYHDYGNVRIIGLNSNGVYASQAQLDWLQTVLDATCAVDSIDFVFAQLHHPHKSELWVDGESNFTGEVIRRMEAFTLACGKPSLHLFGHTHGYSRGDSRDHKHLWVNVATAGGAIDYWGEYVQRDYDEFSVSLDEYGFVTLDVVPGDDPHVTLKRISRGNRNLFRNNELVDELTIRKNDAPVSTPLPLFPVSDGVSPDCVVLKADAFAAGSPSVFHAQSHWQVAPTCDFDAPAVERWRHHQNRYFNVDTQAGDDLTDERVEGLAPNTPYCWRVRYRDSELNWSAWSAPTPFITGQGSLSANLLDNPGAEDGTTAWIPTVGVVESLTDGECNGISPHSGQRYLAVGGVCVDHPFGRAYQDVSVAAYADSIEAGVFQAQFGGYLSDYNGNDRPAMRLVFLDESGTALDSTAQLTTLNSTWTPFAEWIPLPPATRTLRLVLTGTRNAGSDNDSYFDDLFVRVGRDDAPCAEWTVSTRTPLPTVPILNVIPNPWAQQAHIAIPGGAPAGTRLLVTNALGQLVDTDAQLTTDAIYLRNAHLPPGLYFFALHRDGTVVGQGRFVKQ